MMHATCNIIHVTQDMIHDHAIAVIIVTAQVVVKSTFIIISKLSQGRAQRIKGLRLTARVRDKLQKIVEDVRASCPVPVRD